MSNSTPGVDALPPIRAVLEAHDLRARKSLGQHFLLDLNVTRRIVREAALPEAATVIEVGPGPGGLTRALLEAPIRELIVIERDARFAELLQDLLPFAGGRLTVVEGDALSVDAGALGTPPRAIVANLPYNISTPLLIGWLRQVAAFHNLTLMFQREVAERLIAAPGTKAYGRLSVLTQWCAETEILFHLPARAFTPPPKVASSVVQLAPRGSQPPRHLFDAMERVTAAAFGQRRKMLRRSLGTLGLDTMALLDNCGIDGERRAESLSVTEFARLAGEVAANA